jgi:hypothetical protein
MEPNFNPGVVEAEIAQLSKEIAEKRKILETQKGVFEEAGGDKELVRVAMAEKIFPTQPAVTQTTQSAVTPTPPPKRPAQDASYLDSLDQETVQSVNMLVDKAFSGGIEAAVSKAKGMSPFVLDAFHDALTDKLYEEMKSRKLVK